MSNNANKPNPKTSFSLSELLKEEKRVSIVWSNLFFHDAGLLH